MVILAATLATATAVSATGRLGLGQRDAGGEAPGAVVDHPDGEAEVLGVLGALEGAVANADALVADALEAEVGVGDTEVAAPVRGPTWPSRR